MADQFLTLISTTASLYQDIIFLYIMMQNFYAQYVICHLCRVALEVYIINLLFTIIKS